EIVAKMAPRILKAVGASSFNIGVNTGKDSGQAIFHTHLHIIPRRANDGLMEWKNIEMPKGELSNLAEKIRRTQ
ncbi:MAG: HIT family protein, partial [archaeon]